MEDLISKHKDNLTIFRGIEKLNLIKTHPKFNIGDIITFYGGYNEDILYKTKILGFDINEDIYVLWDCYWFPIKDELKRNINIITTT
tara:strand:+ start:435 stop:695 length:261 start_codon:yes stop_codon:yes gene_type:complete